MSESKRAIILAGGKGSRLKPYTIVFPKPLMPVGEYPILEIVVRQLVSRGFDHITIAVNHLADIIKAFFGDGSKWNTCIDYSMENIPLGTMGPLKIIKDLPDDFIVMNGDVLTDLNYSDFLSYHIKNKNIFTISSIQRQDISDYGVLESNNKGFLTGFKEKPVVSHTVSMGIYACNKRILDQIPENTLYGFDHLMLKLLASKVPVSVKNHNSYWLDIGRPDDYEKAIREFETLKHIFPDE